MSRRRNNWPHDVLELFGAKPCPRREGFWVAPCPAKRHRSGRLSLWMGRSGCLVIGCWAGCPKGAVLAAKGLTMGDLFPPREEGAYGRKYAAPPRRIVETYPYTDENGRLLYEVVRYDPKDFRQRRPHGESAYWIWNLEGVRLVLYRLPELLRAPPSALTFVVEGERKCDALRALGLVATTGCGGSGMGWQPGYSKSLAGRRCVILPDNDAAGVRHAFIAAGSLMVYGAAGVRIVPLPGLGQGEDVHDFLKAGGTRKQLVEAIREHPEWRPCR